jgi:hypothetical protein
MQPTYYRITLFVSFFVSTLFTSALLFSQTVLLESSKSIQTFQDGTVSIRGSLAFRDSSLVLTSDNQSVNVGSLSYLRIKSNSFAMGDRTALLSDGVAMGQILYLECTGGEWELFDNQVSPNNVNTSGPRTFTEGDTIQLLWNGTVWLEIHYSNNS